MIHVDVTRVAGAAMAGVVAAVAVRVDLIAFRVKTWD